MSTDLPRLLLGTAALTQRYGIAAGSEARSSQSAVALVRGAIVAGFEGFDTAPDYGSAQQCIGVAGVDAPVYTKFGRHTDPVASLAQSCRSLGRDSVAGCLFHDQHVLFDAGDVVASTAAAVRGVLTSRVGVSIYSPGEFEAALAHPEIDLVQAPVSVADQRLLRNGLLADAARAGKAVFARSVLLQGALLMEADRLPPAVRELADTVRRVDAICADFGVTRLRGLLGFVMSIPQVAGVVLGAETVEQARGLVEACRSPLPDDLFRALLEIEPPQSDVVDPRLW